MKVLVAVDGSTYTCHALDYLSEHMDMIGRDAKITLLTVHLPLPPHAARSLGREAVDGYYSDECEKSLKIARGLLDKAGIGYVDAWKVGDPGDVISAFATKGQFDLVVMGSHGHGLFKALVLGSVATKVLAGCKVPVLLVR
ncbi:MAG: universal stress protein [Burkholderiales bacterium]